MVEIKMPVILCHVSLVCFWGASDGRASEPAAEAHVVLITWMPAQDSTRSDHFLAFLASKKWVFLNFIWLNEDTQHRRFTEEAVATDPESSESELTVESSGEAVASKGKALRKAAAKRAARRQSAPEKPKAGGGVKRNWHHFWKSHMVFDSFVFLLSYSVKFTKSRVFC